MSPEMLLQQGHNHRMDWWCLGLLMHEMISARHPFHGPSHYDTLRNMVTKPPGMFNWIYLCLMCLFYVCFIVQ